MNLIRTYQLAPGAVTLEKLGVDVTNVLDGLRADITTITDTMSTDAERLAAIQAVTDAFQAADSSLQGAITTLGSGITAGAGLNSDGSYITNTDTNYINSAVSIHQATRLLDAQTKTLADALAAEVSARQDAVSTLQASLDGLLGGTLAGKIAKFDVATVAQADVGSNRITVSSTIATDSPVLVFLNGQLVETANLVAAGIGLSDGSHVKLGTHTCQSTSQQAVQTCLQGGNCVLTSRNFSSQSISQSLGLSVQQAGSLVDAHGAVDVVGIGVGDVATIRIQTSTSSDPRTQGSDRALQAAISSLESVSNCLDSSQTLGVGGHGISDGGDVSAQTIQHVGNINTQLFQSNSTRSQLISTNQVHAFFPVLLSQQCDTRKYSLPKQQINCRACWNKTCVKWNSQCQLRPDQTNVVFVENTVNKSAN
jgi:hypothetical protein